MSFRREHKRHINGVDKREVMKAQEKDDRLKEVRNKLAKGVRKTASNGDVHWYEKHAGLIYRMFQSPHLVMLRYISNYLFQQA